MANFTNQGTYEQADSYTINTIEIVRDPNGTPDSKIIIGVNIGKYTGVIDTLSGNETFDSFATYQVVNYNMSDLIQAIDESVNQALITEEDKNDMLALLFQVDDYIRTQAETFLDFCRTAKIAKFPLKVERLVT